MREPPAHSGTLASMLDVLLSVEDMIISVDKGEVEKAIVRHRGPPARLASDWFGDRLLTHSGEVVDFFSGEVLGTAVPRS
jgi:hypothetical protein